MCLKHIRDSDQVLLASLADVIYFEKAKTIEESQHKKSFKKTHQRQWMNEDYNVYAMMNFQTCNLLEKNRKTKIIQGNISYISSDNGLY